MKILILSIALLLLSACGVDDTVVGIGKEQAIEQESIFFIGMVGSDAELYEYSGFFTTCYIVVGDTVSDDFAAISCDH